MSTKEIINEIMQQKHVNQGDLVEPMDMKYQSAVSQALNRDMKVSMLLRFVSVLDCELVIRDTISGKEWEVK